jgi:aspartate/methionine/tyrosine aminotransferase
MEVMYDRLHGMGLKARWTDATFYAWAQLGIESSAEQFSRALLRQTGVAVAPGPFFAPGGQGYMRLSATASTGRICEAMNLGLSGLWKMLGPGQR